MSYPIEKNIPLPPSRRGRPWKYPFPTMEIGDSFLPPMRGRKTSPEPRIHGVHVKCLRFDSPCKKSQAVAGAGASCKPKSAFPDSAQKQSRIRLKTKITMSTQKAKFELFARLQALGFTYA